MRFNDSNYIKIYEFYAKDTHNNEIHAQLLDVV